MGQRGRGGLAREVVSTGRGDMLVTEASTMKSAKFFS